MYTIPVVWHVFTPLANPTSYPEDLIHDALAKLNADFNNENVTHVIFNFVLAKIDPEGRCTSGITYHDSPLVGSLSPVYDVPLKNAVHWDNARYLNIYQVPEIVDYQGQPTTFHGYTIQPCIPRQYQTSFQGFDCSLAGSTPGFDERDGVVIDDGYLQGLTHEVGHWLGLFHTWGPDSYDPEIYPWWTQCGGNCEANGDFICDTNPMQSYGGQGTCHENTCEPNDDFIDPTENFMSYSDLCWNTFSANQYEKMFEILDIWRPDIHSLVNLEATGVINFVDNIFCTGSGVTCFYSVFNLPNNGKIRTGNIYVSNGAHLIIDDDVEIKMCKGSYVYIDKGGKFELRGKLTGDSPGIWDGIIVEGTLTGTSNQATFKGVSGSIVENAKIGVKVMNTYGHKFGKLELNGVTFNNNFTGVKMVSGSDYDFETEIKNCQFTNNVGGIQSFIELERSLDVYIIDCDFTNTYTGSVLGQNGIGVYAKSSRFFVYDDPADLDYSIGCNFYGLDYGIRIESLNSSKYNYIFNNEFKKCQFGIYNLSSNAGRFVFNKFRLEAAPIETSNRYGIYIDGFNSTASIQENLFTSSISSSPSIGVFHDNTGQINKFVRRNTFSNLKFGTEALNVNANNFQGPQAPGLLYTCNNFTSNEKDIYAYTSEINVINVNQKGLGFDPSSNPPQLISVATGNKFNGSAEPGYSSVHNNMFYFGSPFVLNYLRRNEVIEIPVNPVYVNQVLNGGLNCVKEEYSYLEDAPEGGGTSYLNLPEGEEELWDKLNPTLDLLTSLRNEYVEMYDLWMEEIRNNKSEVISNTTIYKDEIGRKLLNLVLSADSINFEKLETIVLNSGSDNSLYVWLLKEYVERENWSQADNIYNILQSNYSDALAQEVSTINSTYNVVKNKQNLDQSDINALKVIADSYVGNGSKWAQTLLSQYGFLYHPRLEEEGEIRSFKPSETGSNSIDFSIAPNPANNSISINIPSRINEVMVDITNVSGVNVFSKKLANSTTLDISSWVNGVYIIQFNDGKSRIQKKLIKVD
ncbi:MAG: T9SS type A sorting domain-containing protein [Saprospiraceae bacterium]|nr:T9SS type A sorting domain-containing protein [Saprospiraceae bacterium]